MKTEVSRRVFVKTGIATALTAGLPEVASADGSSAAFLWAVLLHMGTNMWSDVPVKNLGADEARRLAPGQSGRSSAVR